MKIVLSTITAVEGVHFFEQNHIVPSSVRKLVSFRKDASRAFRNPHRKKKGGASSSVSQESPNNKHFPVITEIENAKTDKPIPQKNGKKSSSAEQHTAVQEYQVLDLDLEQQHMNNPAADAWKGLTQPNDNKNAKKEKKSPRPNGKSPNGKSPRKTDVMVADQTPAPSQSPLPTLSGTTSKPTPQEMDCIAKHSTKGDQWSYKEDCTDLTHSNPPAAFDPKDYVNSRGLAFSIDYYPQWTTRACSKAQAITYACGETACPYHKYCISPKCIEQIGVLRARYEAIVDFQGHKESEVLAKVSCQHLSYGLYELLHEIQCESAANKVRAQAIGKYREVLNMGSNNCTAEQKNGIKNTGQPDCDYRDGACSHQAVWPDASGMEKRPCDDTAGPSRGGPKKSSCFAPDSMVITTWGTRPLSQVKVGELVLTQAGFEKIESFLHKNENAKTEFVVLVHHEKDKDF